jgi:hypothetical protein
VRARPPQPAECKAARYSPTLANFPPAIAAVIHSRRSSEPRGLNAYGISALKVPPDENQIPANSAGSGGSGTNPERTRTAFATTLKSGRGVSKRLSCPQRQLDPPTFWRVQRIGVRRVGTWSATCGDFGPTRHDRSAIPVPGVGQPTARLPGRPSPHFARWARIDFSPKMNGRACPSRRLVSNDIC